MNPDDEAFLVVGDRVLEATKFAQDMMANMHEGLYPNAELEVHDLQGLVNLMKANTSLPEAFRARTEALIQARIDKLRAN